MAHFDEGYQDSFELGNEDIDDAGEDQQTDQFCSKCSPLLKQGGLSQNV